MAERQGASGTLSAGQILKKEGCDSSAVQLHSLPTNDDLPVDEVIVINPLTPPLPALLAPESLQLNRTQPERPREHALLISDSPLDPVIKGMKEDPLWMSEAVSMKSLRVHTHECSLCDKAFGSASALNKHLLSHQQDRPHVCPICQRAFKRHDHLNGHMLTHQKRKPFRCMEPGCQKSYCDGYALKRHCASQHGIFLLPPPPSSAQAHAAAGVWGGDGAGANDYHSIFFSPPKPASKAQRKSADCVGYGGFLGYAGFASGLGVSSGFQQPGAPQTQSLLAPDPWDQTESKDPYGEGAGELHAAQGVSVTPQWVPSLDVEINTVGVSPGSGSRTGLGPQCWESGLDFPVSELQALEEMLSLQTPREALSSGGACTMGPVPSEPLPKTRRPTIVIKQKLRPANPKGRPQQLPPPQSVSSLKGCLHTQSMAAPRSVDNSALGQSSPEEPTQTPKPALQRGAEVRKKRARKRKAKEADLPAPSFPPPLPAARRQWPHPLYLVSPSQVAMASFSKDSTSGHPYKGALWTAPLRVHLQPIQALVWPCRTPPAPEESPDAG
ncbi:zinc finger protein 827-like [Conger conger]|uniref:zinc finger protein 827-like n=1 Tax=Conger conger TaxID=82655 RepID=UPI002A59F22F|nr:zinc finger protein 827-like [Conger conger]